MTNKNQNISEEEQKVLDSVRMSRIVPPIILGLLVVMYLMWRQLDVEEFNKIQWDGHILFWIGMAVLSYVARHLFYAWRLRMLSDYKFSWGKSIQLIFIWEFASSVSPTSIGGSAVALFLLAQEKISNARAVSIVIYSVVMDTFFFLFMILLLYFILGPIVIRPGMESFSDLDGFGVTFITVLGMMVIYGLVFFYGLFINPRPIKRFFLFLSKRKILGRFKQSLRQTAMDVVTSSKEMASKSMGYHTNVFISTAGAWALRFLCINCIIIALVPSTSLDFWNQFLMYGRGIIMYVVTAFSPTPGGAGIAEIVFGGFYSDFIAKGISLVAALIWRLITYYPYLIIGVIIIPYWFRNIINRRKRRS